MLPTLFAAGDPTLLASGFHATRRTCATFLVEAYVSAEDIGAARTRAGKSTAERVYAAKHLARLKRAIDRTERV